MPSPAGQGREGPGSLVAEAYPYTIPLLKTRFRPLFYPSGHKMNSPFISTDHAVNNDPELGPTLDSDPGLDLRTHKVTFEFTILVIGSRILARKPPATAARTTDGLTCSPRHGASPQRPLEILANVDAVLRRYIMCVNKNAYKEKECEENLWANGNVIWLGVPKHENNREPTFRAGAGTPGRGRGGGDGFTSSVMQRKSEKITNLTLPTAAWRRSDCHLGLKPGRARL
ncbi:hypothetical protein EVAR_98075_1 [Eumeta japonica]|uniref:Uncharacterized protein n=1 Tax=Eumeta variegata TaxID=151549 RepID=A0A4C1WCT2_EUMVA|nr:hypothetical protein EVAR_98075_1 [Eumeta japonica]